MNELTTYISDAIYEIIDSDRDLKVAQAIQTVNKSVESRDRFEQEINVLAMNSYELRKTERESANSKELWNPLMTHAVYQSDYEDIMESLGERKVAKCKLAIKVKPAINRSYTDSYIPKTPSASKTTYDAFNIYNADESVVKSSYINTALITGYTIYRKAIVLDIISDYSKRDTISFDDYLLNRRSERIDTSRNTDESNQLITHIVFRYEPFTKRGLPNPYDGITQLKNWLKSMKCVTTTEPKTISDALNAIVGQTLDIPSAFNYIYKESSDNLTVFSVFGDFENFEDAFDTSVHEYQSPTEWFSKDRDNDGNIIDYPDEHLTSECMLIGDLKDFMENCDKGLIKYDCHKEFRESLPLRYSHVGYIFD